MTILDLSEVREEEFFNSQPTVEGYSLWQRALLRIGMGIIVLPVIIWLFAAFFLTLVGALTAGSFTDRVWRSCRLAAASLVASTVGIFSVQFGVTILCVYLLIHVDEREGRLATFLRSSVQEAFHKL